MKTKKTQIDWVIQELRKVGHVSRNKALARYITRLGAIMYKLKKEYGIYTTGFYKKTKHGHDYIYKG